MNQVPRSSRLPPLALATGVAVLPLVMCTQPAICGLGVVALVILFGWCGVALSARRWLLPLLGVQLVALCLVRITGLWPCDIACQGGSHYQHLAGIPVVYPALAAYALLTAVAIRDALRGRWSPALGRIAYACAGCSLFYLWVAMRLGMECGFCRAVHLSTLLTLACLMPLRAGLLWCQALAWLGGAFLALNMVYHHRVVADVAGPLDRSVPTAGSGSPDAIVALRASSVYHAMVSGRTRGAATGRYRVIVVIDPHCPVCAEEYGPLCAAVLPARGPAIPTLALETLIMLRPSDPSGADLARHLLATASLGSSRFDAVLAVVLGTPAGLDFTGMRSRIAEVDDPSQLEAALEHDRSAVEQLLSDDGERLRELNGGKARAITPQVLLLQRGPTGAETVIRSWQGRLDPSQVAADIRTLVAH